MENVEKPLNEDTVEKVVVVEPLPFENPSMEALFTYHPPTDETIPLFKRIREMGLEFALAIDEYCPPCPDKHAAIRKVREAVMTANAAIACCGKEM